MNKYREALSNIIISLADTDFVMEHINDFEMLKELVDKATPKKPKITIINAQSGAYQCDCPICGKFLSVNCKWDDANYCNECGQAIDWSDDSETN